MARDAAERSRRQRWKTTALAFVASAACAAGITLATSWVGSFERTTSASAPTVEARADWMRRQGLPSATLAPVGGQPADSTVVYSRWWRRPFFAFGRTRALHLVARVPPDSLDLWHRPAQESVGPGAVLVTPGLERTRSPETDWLGTLPPGPPTSGVTEWYGTRHRMVGLDRERGIVAYRMSVDDTHYRVRPWPFGDF